MAVIRPTKPAGSRGGERGAARESTPIFLSPVRKTPGGYGFSLLGSGGEIPFSYPDKATAETSRKDMAKVKNVHAVPTMVLYGAIRQAMVGKGMAEK